MRFAAAVVALFLAIAPVGAQQGSAWGILAEGVSVDLTAGDGSAVVTVEWLLTGADSEAPLPGDESVPLSLLAFGAADVDDVLRDGRETIVLWPTSGSRRTATVRPPFDSDDSLLVMRFNYRVASAVEFEEGRARARVPVLTGPPIVAGNASGAELAAIAAAGVGVAGFSAEVRVPDGWIIADGFPSGLRRTESGVYTVALPAAPAMIGIRARMDGRWIPGVPFLIDVLTVVLLLAFAGFGWRHLRSVVSARATASEAVEGGLS